MDPAAQAKEIKTKLQMASKNANLSTPRRDGREARPVEVSAAINPGLSELPAQLVQAFDALVQSSVDRKSAKCYAT
jgi:hypothetical protein